MATAFGLLRTVLNTINETPILCEMFYILTLQRACQNRVSESDQRRILLSFVLVLAVCEWSFLPFAIHVIYCLVTQLQRKEIRETQFLKCDLEIIKLGRKFEEECSISKCAFISLKNLNGLDLTPVSLYHKIKKKNSK